MFVCVYVSVCTYVCMFACICVCMYVCYIFIFVCMSVHMYLCVYLCMGVCMYVCIQTLCTYILYTFLISNPYIGICIGAEGKLPEKYDKEQYQAVTDLLVRADSAKSVIFFCREVQLASFLSEMHKQVRKLENMQFIGSETMDQPWILERARRITARVIYTRPLSKSIRDFDEYFSNLNPAKNWRNPWFKDFYEETMNCLIDENGNQSSFRGEVCNPNQTLGSKKLLTDEMSLNLSTQVVDAVYAFAHALHRLQENLCGNSSFNCKPLRDVSGKVLLDTIRNSTFASLTGRRVQFNSKGDVTGGYAVYYVHGETSEHIKIGEWEGELRVNSASLCARKIMLKSRCSETCGARQIQQGILRKPSCCWKCENCRPNEIVHNKTICRACERGYVPDRNFHTCLKIQPIYYTLDSNVSFYLVIPPLLLSGLGILAIGFTVFIFIRFNNTPLVKASSRELSYLLLIGLFLSYFFPLVCIVKPSLVKCFFQFVLDSLPSSVSYVAIVVKTNRIFRIFDKKRLITKRPAFARPRSQIVLSLGLISFQVILVLVLVTLDFPRTELVYFTPTEVHLVCSISDIQLTLSHLYNFILVIVCTYYGYKTKHIPRNFNEAKYIALAMYGSCLMIVTFTVLFVVTAKMSDKILTLSVHCYRVTLMSTVLLTCFFAPKVYIILLKPANNVKRLTFNDEIMLPIQGTRHEMVESR